MEINDIPNKDSVYFLDDDMVCFRISSEDDTACQKIHSILSNLFLDEKVLYKFIGFDADIQPIKDLLESGSARYYKGKCILGFYTVSYPELHAEIPDSDTLWTILRNWTSTIYHTHAIYVLDAENTDRVNSALERDVGKDTDSILSTWSDAKLVIRNQPEADYHNTFLLLTHKQYYQQIKDCFAL